MEGEDCALPELQIKKRLRTAALLPSLSLLLALLTYSSASSASWTPLNLLCRQGVNGAQTCLGMCNCTEIPVCVREGDMGQGLASHTVWSQEMQACQVYYTHTYIPLI